MLSIDEWCNTVTRGILNNALESALIFVLFIFVANFILLNIMLAIACNEIQTTPQKAKSQENCDFHVIRHSFQKVLRNLLILIEFKHKFLYKKLKNHKIFTENAFYSKPNPRIEEITDIEDFYELKHMLSLKENQEFFIEYKGKRVSMKKSMLLEINKNCEIIISNENIDKIKKNATFSSFDKSFFEIEIPANKVPSGNQTFCEKIMNFWVLIKQKLSNPEGKSLDFQSF